MYKIKLAFVVHATVVFKAKARHLSDYGIRHMYICSYNAYYGFRNFSFERKTKVLWIKRMENHQALRRNSRFFVCQRKPHDLRKCYVFMFSCEKQKGLFTFTWKQSKQTICALSRTRKRFWNGLPLCWWMWLPIQYSPWFRVRAINWLSCLEVKFEGRFFTKQETEDELIQLSLSLLLEWV